MAAVRTGALMCDNAPELVQTGFVGTLVHGKLGIDKSMKFLFGGENRCISLSLDFSIGLIWSICHFYILSTSRCLLVVLFAFFLIRLSHRNGISDTCRLICKFLVVQSFLPL